MAGSGQCLGDGLKLLPPKSAPPLINHDLRGGSAFSIIFDQNNSGSRNNLDSRKAKCPIFMAIVAGFRGKVAYKNRNTWRSRDWCFQGNCFQVFTL